MCLKFLHKVVKVTSAFFSIRLDELGEAGDVLINESTPVFTMALPPNLMTRFKVLHIFV